MEATQQSEHRGDAPGQLTAQLVSIADAARTLGITQGFMRKLVRNGAVRTVHIGRRILVSAAEIRRVVAEGAR
jgi:excisionase family DNA binding protein